MDTTIPENDLNPSPFRSEDQFAIVPSWVFDWPGVTPTHIATFAALAMLANRETDRFYLSQEHLAAFMHTSERTARRNIGALVDLGLLQRVHMWFLPGHGKPQAAKKVANAQAPNDYRLLRADAAVFPQDAFTGHFVRQRKEAGESIPATSEMTTHAHHSGQAPENGINSISRCVSTGGQDCPQQPDKSVHTQPVENGRHNRELQQRTQQSELRRNDADVRCAPSSPMRSSDDDNDTKPLREISPDWCPDDGHRNLARQYGLDVDRLGDTYRDLYLNARTDAGRRHKATNYDANFAVLLHCLRPIDESEPTQPAFEFDGSTNVPGPMDPTERFDYWFEPLDGRTWDEVGRPPRQTATVTPRRHPQPHSDYGDEVDAIALQYETQGGVQISEMARRGIAITLRDRPSPAGV